jgi:hypothetical protein
MKKLVLISAIAISGLLYNTADAQFGIHVGIRLFPHRIFADPGSVVVQSPADPDQVTYADNADDFYYLPDVGAYYSVDEQLYYYFDGENWITSAYLPGVYSDYDWRYVRRIEIREARPYLHNDFYRNQYNGFDCDLAHNSTHFREGFDIRQQYRDAYNDQPRFDNHRFDNNRGGYDQHFDNRGVNDQRFYNRNANDQKFDNRGGNDQQFNTRGNDNRFDNRGQAGFDHNSNRGQQQGGQQFDQKRDRGINGGQQVNQAL